jgi:hypothetical protein
VRCNDVSQQLLFAHDPASQFCPSVVLASMQGVTGSRAVAAPNEARTRSDATTLPSMRSYSTWRSRERTRNPARPPPPFSKVRPNELRRVRAGRRRLATR